MEGFVVAIVAVRHRQRGNGIGLCIQRNLNTSIIAHNNGGYNIHTDSGRRLCLNTGGGQQQGC